MKVLLINPGVGDISKLVGRFAKYLTPVLPHGIAYIAASLQKDGHEVMVEDQFASGVTHRELAERIKRESIDLVGLSTLTAGQHEAEALVQIIKSQSPDTKIVLGNIHATIFGKECLKETGADFIVHGEGEITICELASALEENRDLNTVKGITFLRDGEFTQTLPREPIEDLDSLPFPAWDLFDLSKYPSPPFLNKINPIIPLIITRGCPYRCNFCSQNAIFSGKVRGRRAKNVVDEMEWAYDKFGATHFGLNDAIFPYTEKQLFEFTDEIIRRGLHKKIIWFTEMRVDLVTREMLRAMKESSMYMVMLGIESGDNGVLKRANKRQTVEEIRKAIHLIAREGIMTLGLFIIGLPGETKETAMKTIKMARELPLSFAKFNRATPYPGSELYKMWLSERNGHDKILWEKFSAWAPPEEADDVLYVPEGLTARELKDLQSLAVRRFYLKPSRIAFLISRRLIDRNTIINGAQIITGGIFDQISTAFNVRKFVAR